MHIFAAKIYKIGIIRYVDVPADVSKAFRPATSVAVSGTVENAPLRTTMVSRGNGCYRLAIQSDIRKKLRADAGAVVEVAIERDEESREPTLPPALVLGLRQSPNAQAHFRGMTTALRRQIVRYLVGAKQLAVVEKRCAKFVKRLEILAREKKAKGDARHKRRKA